MIVKVPFLLGMIKHARAGIDQFVVCGAIDITENVWIFCFAFGVWLPKVLPTTDAVRKVSEFFDESLIDAAIVIDLVDVRANEKDAGVTTSPRSGAVRDRLR